MKNYFIIACIGVQCLISQAQDWKINKFNWYDGAPTSDDWYYYNPANSQLTKLTFPFVEANRSGNYLSTIYEDKYREDGWELVKQDFGYFNNDNLDNLSNRKWASGQMYPGAIPYMILYNRYKGVMRIFGYSRSTVANFVKVTVKFGDEYTNILNPGQPDKKTRVGSGIFRLYENGGESALDQPSTAVEQISSFSVTPVNDFRLFYADFNLSYDPCICKISSSMEVEFKLISQANLSAFGYSINQNDAESKSDIFASVLQSGQTIDGGIATFRSTQNLQDKLNELSGVVDGESQSNITQFGGILKGAETGSKLLKSGGEILKTFESAKKVLDKLESIPVLGAISSVVDFISILVGEEQPVAKPTPYVSAISGTVTLEALPASFQLATMGSPATSSVVNLRTFQNEYANGTDANVNATSGWYGKPVYPMYNSVPGVFALLKTPTVKIISETNNSSNTYLNSPSVYRVSFELPKNNELMMAMNKDLPIADQSLLFMYQIEVFVPHRGVKFSGLIQTSPEDMENLKIIYKEVINQGSPAVGTNFILQTPLLSFEKLSRLIPNIKCIGSKPAVKDVKLKIVGTVLYSTVDYSGNRYNANIFSRTFKVNKTFVSKPQVENFAALNPQNLKSITYTITSPRSNVGTCIYEFATIPLNLLVTSDNYVTVSDKCSLPRNLTINALNSITITSNVSYNGNISFQANDQVSVEGESVISGEVTLSNTSGWGYVLPNESNPIVLDDAFLTSYCVTDQVAVAKYNADLTKANAREEESVVSTENKIKNTSTSDLSAYPNPVWTTTTFIYHVSNPSNVKLYVTNGYGQIVEEIISKDNHEAGAFEVEYSTQNIPAGMYLLVLDADGRKETIKLSVVK